MSTKSWALSVAVALAWAACAALGGQTTRVSLGPGGVQANDTSNFPSVSHDGRYTAFQSTADNLVADDTNNASDIFVHDCLADITQRVSTASGGDQANDSSFNAMISADGRFVAFESYATNLVAGDTNAWPDIFVHDRLTGTTQRVSVHTDGTQADNQSSDPDITPDGRFVTFMSKAGNLVTPPDTNGEYDIYIHDRLTHATQRVSVDSDGHEANARSSGARVSDDGRYVAFYSNASNLVPDDTNSVGDVFRHDRLTGQTIRVSLTWDNRQADQRSVDADISADGAVIAFQSWAALVPDDTNGQWDIYVRDMVAGTLERVSVSTTGDQGDGASIWPWLSADGRLVSFTSQAANLVPGDTNAVQDVFLRDRRLHRTHRISVSSSGAEGNDISSVPVIAGNGRHVAFASTADNLVAADTNNAKDIFVRQPFHPADFDFDDDVDQEDFGHLQACLSGPDVPQEDPACLDARLDDDADVDHDDAVIFEACATAPNQPADPACTD